MKKWLMELMEDMTFLVRKARRSARVVAKAGPAEMRSPN